MNFLNKLNPFFIIIGLIITMILGINFGISLPIFFIFFFNILYLGFSKDKFKKLDMISLFIGSIITQIILWIG